MPDRWMFGRFKLCTLFISSRWGWVLTCYRVLLEHIGFYALSRSAHEKADVFHAMVVTVRIMYCFVLENTNSS